MFHLPELLALSLFRLIYPYIRKLEGSPAPPIQHREQPIKADAVYEFDQLFNSVL
jgi:hypothetical protein